MVLLGSVIPQLSELDSDEADRLVGPGDTDGAGGDGVPDPAVFMEDMAAIAPLAAAPIASTDAAPAEPSQPDVSPASPSPVPPLPVHAAAVAVTTSPSGSMQPKLSPVTAGMTPKQPLDQPDVPTKKKAPLDGDSPSTGDLFAKASGEAAAPPPGTASTRGTSGVGAGAGAGADVGSRADAAAATALSLHGAATATSADVSAHPPSLPSARSELSEELEAVGVTRKLQYPLMRPEVVHTELDPSVEAAIVHVTPTLMDLIARTPNNSVRTSALFTLSQFAYSAPAARLLLRLGVLDLVLAFFPTSVKPKRYEVPVDHPDVSQDGPPPTYTIAPTRLHAREKSTHFVDETSLGACVAALSTLPPVDVVVCCCCRTRSCRSRSWDRPHAASGVFVFVGGCSVPRSGRRSRRRPLGVVWRVCRPIRCGHRRRTAGRQGGTPTCAVLLAALHSRHLSACVFLVP